MRLWKQNILAVTENIVMKPACLRVYHVLNGVRGQATRTLRENLCLAEAT